MTSEKVDKVVGGSSSILNGDEIEFKGSQGGVTFLLWLLSKQAKVWSIRPSLLTYAEVNCKLLNNVERTPEILVIYVVPWWFLPMLTNISKLFD